MVDRRRPRSIAAALLQDLLTGELTQWQCEQRPDVAPVMLEVVDVGGGTGGVASALAALGYRVTVVDPSPDALASLARRAAEAGLSDRLRGLQGDASDLPQVIGAEGADVVLCHRVLEVVDSPADAVQAMAGLLRPGGGLSLVVSQRHAQVLSQALSGHIVQARQTFADAHRFDHGQVVRWVEEAGLRVRSSAGVGALADHVPEVLVDVGTVAYDELYALEREISVDPAFRAVAPLVHLFAERPSDVASRSA